jgi:carboxymethylenebutenolidase
MKLRRSFLGLTLGVVLTLSGTPESRAAETVSFKSGDKILHGLLYKPNGPGPFPAIVYNHGGAAGMLSKEAFDALGPVFVSRGWVFFGPFRRGQGLSASAGPYIGDQIAAAKKNGMAAAALEWLRQQAFIRSDRIAVAGNSFGGVEAVLGAERGKYCAAVDSAGGAQSWAQAPRLRAVMTRAVQNSKTAIFFFQAANDYDLSPSKTLSEAMKEAARPHEFKIYPAYGSSAEDGHSFGYFGSAVWADDVFRFLNRYCP